MSKQAEKKDSGKQQYAAPQKPAAPVHTGCQYKGCKTAADRFGFCYEHYDQFKFGLIRKDGQPAADYDKKYEEYSTYRKKVGVKKVA